MPIAAIMLPARGRSSTMEQCSPAPPSAPGAGGGGEEGASAGRKRTRSSAGGVPGAGGDEEGPRWRQTALAARTPDAEIGLAPVIARHLVARLKGLTKDR